MLERLLSGGIDRFLAEETLKGPVADGRVEESGYRARWGAWY
jgi:hypothetical protein